MTRLLAGIEYSSLLAGITLASIQTILSTVLLGVSLVTGIINLFLLIKKAVENDGKIDEKEAADIKEQIEDIQDKINKMGD